MTTPRQVYIKLLKTGGGATAMDGISASTPDSNGHLLADGDPCSVYESGVLFPYMYDADSGLTDDGLNVITPVVGTPGAGRWILQTPVRLFSLQNLLSNTEWKAMSGSTLVEAVGGAAPVTDGANAALVNNLLTNGGFDSATTGWTAGDSTLASVAGGKTGNCLEITRVGNSGQHAYQQVTTVPGKLYYVSAYVKSGTSGNEEYDVVVKNGATQIAAIVGASSASWVMASTVFEATGTTTLIYLWKNTATAGTMLFDSVTLYEVTPGYVAADTLAPDGWEKDSTLDIFRQHNDSTYTKDGSFYTLKMNSGAANDSCKWPVTSTEPNHLKRFAGRTATIGAWIYATDASHARLGAYDSVNGWRYSSFHTGVAGWQWIEVTFTVASASTQTCISLENTTSGKTAYFSQPMLVLGSYCGQGNFAPIGNERIGYQTPFVLTGYSAAVPADATINLEAASDGKIGKGVKKVYGYHIGTNSAAAKYLKLCTSSGVVNSHLISQVAAGPVSSGYEVKCDANGDMYIDVEDANWSAYSLYVTGIET